MKRQVTIWTIILLAVAGCGGCQQSGTESEDIITVDVTASYPHKELVLQDFMDVEYIPLETTDEFLCQGNIQAVGKNILIVKNFSNDGNIFIYDRSGKAIKRINHKGGGNEEYSGVANIAFDEKNNEMFVNDYHARNILVYDLEGNFKRKLSHDDNILFSQIYNFDQNNLICHDDFNTRTLNKTPGEQSFILISKQDGSFTHRIQIPFKEKRTIHVRTPPNKVTGEYMSYNPGSVHPMMPYFDDYILAELSSDTLYRYSADQTLKPFIARTPSIQSMNPEVFLMPSLLTDRYYFMEAVEKTMDFYATDLVYDKQEKALYRYKVYNSDYTGKKEAFLKSKPINGEIPSRQFLVADELVRANERGRLKGQLKEIASKLDEDSNPVIMLIKHKK